MGYKEDCEYQWEGHGNNKVWVPIPGTCKNNPYDECKEVTKTKEDRWPTQCVMMFLNSLAEMFQDKCAEMFLTKFAGTSLRSSVPRFPDRNVILFTKSFP